MSDSNKNHYRFSPRYLGKMRQTVFCPHCFWYLVALGFHPPFEMPMAGIMYNLDNFEKNIVDAHFAKYGKLPAWLCELNCVEPVSFPAKMTCEFPSYGMTMVGKPDAVFRKEDGTLYLVDYKSARYKGEDDPFLPCYETQLLGYAHLLEACGVGEVTSAALVYFQNMLADFKEAPLKLFTKEGFQVPFGVKIHPVKLDRDELDPLVKRLRKFVDMSAPPSGSEGCKDCEALDRLFALELKRRNIEKSLDKLNLDARSINGIIGQAALEQREFKTRLSWTLEDQAEVKESDVDFIPGPQDY
jgi:hypothetical protein